jgi:hypothetical protein
MADQQDMNERIVLLKDTVSLGQEIETAFLSKIHTDFKDRSPYDITNKEVDNYFVHQFLRNALEHASSAITLAENDFSKPVWLIARTILEGWFYFKSFVNNRSPGKMNPITQKWRCFYVCQDYQSVRKSEGEAAAIQMLNDLENRIGTDLVRQAEREFQDCQNEKSKWYGQPTLKKLIKVDGDTSLERFYKSVYSTYSQVQHWNPVVVIATEIDPDMALIGIVHNIFRMLLHINDFYDLKFDDRLQDIYRRSLKQLFRETLLPEVGSKFILE